MIILEEYLGVRKTDFSIAERWTHCPPDEAEGKGIEEYIEKVACIILSLDSLWSDLCTDGLLSVLLRWVSRIRPIP